MPIQIIDGFKLNTNTPIDTRLVTTGTSSRNAMSYKYDGLRVYDTVQKIPFVYIDGAWKEESVGITTTSTGGSNATGKTNYISKFGTTGLTNSNIRELISGVNKFVGVNVLDNIQLAHTLHVGGTLKVDSTVTAQSFVGTISGANVAGPIDISKLSVINDTNKYILKCENKSVKWVAESTSSTSLDVQNNTQLTEAYLLLVDGVGNNKSIYSYSSNSNAISANLLTGQLMLSNGWETAPGYSFKNNLTTGIYGSQNELGLSFLGSKSIYVNSTSVSISIGTTNIVEFTNTSINLNRNLTTGTNNITVGGTTTLTNTTINGVATLSGTTNITGNATLSGTAILNGTTTLSGTTTLNGTTTITGPSINTSLTVTTSNITTPPNKIINNSGTGLYIKSAGELRLDTNSAGQVNIITFFKAGEGATLGSLSPTYRRGWLGYGSISNDTFYIYNDVGSLRVGNGSGDVFIDGNVNIGENGTKGLTVWGETIRTAAYIQIKAQPGKTYATGPHTSTNPAGTFFGRYPASQEIGTDGDAFIRVDKHATLANWDGYYTFSTGGTFTSKKLKLENLPTSSSGLAPGTVWRDGTNLKIV